LTTKLFETNRLVAYQLNASFANIVLSYYENNADHFKKSMPLWSEDFLTFDYQMKLLMKQGQDINNGTFFKFWLFEKEDTELTKIVGDVSLGHIIRGSLQSCFMGYKMDQKFVGIGLMYEALTAVIQYAFKTLKLHRLEVNIMPSNIDSVSLAERLLFKKEGFSPNYLKINGKWENHIRYAMLNEMEEV